MAVLRPRRQELSRFGSKSGMLRYPLPASPPDEGGEGEQGEREARRLRNVNQVDRPQIAAAGEGADNGQVI